MDKIFILLGKLTFIFIILGTLFFTARKINKDITPIPVIGKYFNYCFVPCHDDDKKILGY